ncbi:nucleotidyltransferase family protein [Pedobacter sp. UC225_61]|uniref:nucleotidyltransferase family protein n=1 Tax=Pedobacter sp. UC225_61 TaxID=3374623 RepID=UPI0037BA09D0
MNLIPISATIKDALKTLNQLESGFTLFVKDSDDKIVGTLTDGDIRRGLINGHELTALVELIMNKKFEFLTLQTINSNKIYQLRNKKIFQVPLLNDEFKIIKILDLENIKGYISVDVLIMAGGEGTRLRPLTLEVPKPLLKVGEKPIIEHNIDRLMGYGVNNFCISTKYLAEKIETYFGNGEAKKINICYVLEDTPMGTIGALKLMNNVTNDDVLVMNSDLLTNIDFEDFYNFFKSSNADMAVATTAYNVNVPYAVLELGTDNSITSLKEKPTYTYYSNAGIYLIKKEMIDLIPESTFFNATDLMELIIGKNLKLVNYPILGYWLDIGNHTDFAKAQEDIKHIQLY